MRNLHKHFNWFWAKSIQESVQIYEDLEKKYITVDVLFLDLSLQDSKGIEFLNISKTKDWLENTLIVIMTDSKENGIIKECSDCLTNRSYTFYPKAIKNVDFACLSEEIIKHIKKISCPLKDYKIIKHIATGFQADVYKVIGIKNRKIFAMKVNKKKYLYPAEDKFLKKINSPNVIHLYESKKIKGKVYMILEYSEKGNLSERIKEYSKTNKKFDENQILDWMIQIFIGLYSLHKNDIMHRDLNSDNLLLFNNDILKISDLGCSTNELKCKSEIGKKEYRAPEMQDFGEYKKEIDIFSAGVVLYELIMLCRPFEGINRIELRYRIKNIDYKPVPEETDSRLKKLLSLTLTYKEERASAAQLLSLDFIKNRINYFYVNKIIDFEKDFIEEILNLNYSYEENKLKTVEKKYNYLKCFQNIQKIYYKYPKTTLYKNIEVISHSSLFNKSINEDDIKDLIDLNILLPYEDINNNKKRIKINSKEKNNNKYEANYYRIIKYKDDGIDNTLNLPITNNDFYDNFYKDDLMKTYKVFEKVKEAFYNFKHILEDKEAKEEDKYLYAMSEDIFEFLLEIKDFHIIKLKRYDEEDKLAMMLNIYQIMIYHYIMKSVMSYNKNEENSIFSKILTLLGIGKTSVSLKYIIAGDIFTIQDMKHFIFKIKSPPKLFSYKSLNENDQSEILDEKFLNELPILNKLAILTICIDPPNFINKDKYDKYIPIGKCFKPYNLYKDLNSCLYHYISENNIFPDENNVNFPKIMHYYIKQLGEKENDVIQTLIKFFFKDSTQKMLILINKSKRNKLHINYC